MFGRKLYKYINNSGILIFHSHRFFLVSPLSRSSPVLLQPELALSTLHPRRTFLVHLFAFLTSLFCVTSHSSLMEPQFLRGVTSSWSPPGSLGCTISESVGQLPISSAGEPCSWEISLRWYSFQSGGTGTSKSAGS